MYMYIHALYTCNNGCTLYYGICRGMLTCSRVSVDKSQSGTELTCLDGSSVCTFTYMYMYIKISCILYK